MGRLAATPETIRTAARYLRAGGLVAFPTETVYGLGAAALDPAAAARIFEAKERPRFDPLICHIDAIDRLPTLAAVIPAAAAELADRFWPGPLTLVLPKRAEVPDLVTSGQPTVAVRVPRHPVARALLTAFGDPIAAPSANRFGAISPTSAGDVEAQLGDRVEIILEGGRCAVGVESTIVAFPSAGLPVLLRPGGIPKEAIEDAIGPIEVPPPSAYPGAAPGRLARHYAPRTPIALGDRPSPPTSTSRLGRLAFTGPPPPGFAAVEVLSPSGDLEEAARNLFAALRRLDAAEVDLILAEPVPEVGLGRAIMDRLRRAEAAWLPSATDDDPLEP